MKFDTIGMQVLSDTHKVFAVEAVHDKISSDDCGTIGLMKLPHSQLLFLFHRTDRTTIIAGCLVYMLFSFN